MNDEHVAVLVVGGGPAGLTAAAALAPKVQGDVCVLEREATAGGIPRHSDHPGYGLRDLHRFLSGPAYARTLRDAAAASGAVVETEAMVTGWAGDRTVEVTSPRGRRRISGAAVVLATGARERPRTARLIPGDRPAGVYTTGQLQNLVHLHHTKVGRRAVIVGAELVSWSAVLTLREAGCATALLTSEYPHPESYLAFRAAGALVLRTPVATRTRVTAIHGRPRVEAVELTDLDTGARRIIDCDTVVTTGDWIPDNELARAAGLCMDPATRGPKVDTALSTSQPGVFAIGNLLHPVDTADVAALDGRHVARPVLTWLRRGAATSHGLPLSVEAPLRWVTPQLLHPHIAPPRGRLLLWSDAHVTFPQVRATQDGRVLAEHRLPWPCAPGRVFRVPSSLVADADLAGGEIRLSLVNAPGGDAGGG